MRRKEERKEGENLGAKQSSVQGVPGSSLHFINLS